MKFCKDCLYYRHVPRFPAFCMYNPSIDPVSGGPVNKYCDVERLANVAGDIRRCGLDGQFWIEAKPF